jgi:hypothetical protein
MQELFLRLLKGDMQLATQFRNAKRAWDRFIEEYGALPIAELAEKLSMYQARLEKPFEQNRPFAKEMLPIAGLASLWSEERDGYEDPELADKLIRAIRNSKMSGEVRHAYLEAALQIFPLRE